MNKCARTEKNLLLAMVRSSLFDTERINPDNLKLAYYAGYISVWVQTSTTDNTYVRVIWSSHGVNYDESITVGVSGTAVFPVLPTSSIEIRVGNWNWLSGATETVTITYHY